MAKMSPEEFPSIPARPQRRVTSPSPSPAVPARPGSTLPTPQVPTRRPERVKTSDVTSLREVKNREYDHQGDKEDSPEGNEMKAELQDELLKKKELELRERRIQQANKEKELAMLDKRREELMLEREREREQELIKQRELELEDQKQKETERKQEIELEAKRKELVEFEKEHQLAKEKNTVYTESKENIKSDNDAILEGKEIPRIPERPKKSESPTTDTASKQDAEYPKIPERRPRPIGRGSSESLTSPEGRPVEFPAVPTRRPERLKKQDISESSKPLEKKLEPSEEGSKPSEEKSKPSEEKLEPSEEKPEPSEKKPEPSEKKPEPSEEKPEPSEKKPEPSEKKPEPSEEKPEPSEEKPEPSEEKPEPSEEKPEPSEDNLERSEKKPLPSEKKPEPSEEKPIEKKPSTDFSIGEDVDAESPVMPERKLETMEKKLAADINMLFDKKPRNLENEPLKTDDQSSSIEPSEKQPTLSPAKPEKELTTEHESESPVVSEKPNGDEQDSVLEKPDTAENIRELSSKPEEGNLESDELKTVPLNVSKEERIESPVTPEHKLEKTKTEEHHGPKVPAADTDEKKGEPTIKPEDKKSGESTGELPKKKAPPVPKKPSSRIAAFQEMLRKQQMEEMQDSRRKEPEYAHEKSKNDVTDSSDTSQPSVPQRPARKPINAERSKFANNLNGIFALPGMSPMGGLPPSFAKKMDPAPSAPSHEEKKENQNPSSSSVSDVRSSRARGPRGRKLPSNLASVEKVNGESKTNEIEIFKTWKTVIQTKEEPIVSEPIEVTNPTHFDLDNSKATKPLDLDANARGNDEGAHNAEETTVTPKDDIRITENRPHEAEKEIKEPLISEGTSEKPGKQPSASEGQSVTNDEHGMDAHLGLENPTEDKDKEQEHKDEFPISGTPLKGQADNQPLIPERPSVSKSLTTDGSASAEKSTEHQVNEQEAEPLVPQRPIRRSKEPEESIGSEPSEEKLLHDKTHSLSDNFPEVSEPVPETSFSLGNTDESSKESNKDLLLSVNDVGESQLQSSTEFSESTEGSDLLEAVEQKLKQDDEKE